MKVIGLNPPVGYQGGMFDIIPTDIAGYPRVSQGY